MARLPTTEETLMMRPPSPICGRAAWMQFSGPTVLTSNTCLTSAALTSEILPDSPSPALLTSTSSDPNSPTAFLTMASTEPRSETSVSTTSATPPEAEMSRRRPPSFSTALEASTTEVPRAASSLAVASPMPLEAPVTTATLPPRLCSTEVITSRGWSVFRPGAGRSPGRAPRREDRRILVPQRDIVELVKNPHDLLFTTLLAGGQPLGSLQILQPAQAPHLADHYLPSFHSCLAISTLQSIGARIVARSGLRPTLVGMLGLAPSLVRTALRALSARSRGGLVVSHREYRCAGRPYAELAATDRDDQPKASPERAKRCRQAKAEGRSVLASRLWRLAYVPFISLAASL